MIEQPAWRPVAEQMRADGAPTREIAAACGITVQYLIAWENGFYDGGVPDESELIERHVYRIPTQRLAPQDQKMAAVKRFAAGEITRAELSQQIWREAA